MTHPIPWLSVDVQLETIFRMLGDVFLCVILGKEVC